MKTFKKIGAYILIMTLFVTAAVPAFAVIERAEESDDFCIDDYTNIL